MTEKTLTTENIKPALDALRGELAPWPVVAKKQDRLNTAQLNAANSGITSSLVAQIIANTAAIRALESAITGTGLRALVVSSLPAVGTLGILYIVPVTTYDPDTDADVVNYSNEYIWIVAPDAPVTEGYYEQVGQTGIVINNGQLTIKANNVSVGTFTANQAGNTDVNITVPTNADYVDLSTSQTVTGGKTWTGEQSFTLPIVGSITGTASKAIADEDGTSIKTGYGKLAGDQTWTGTNTFTNNLLTRDPSSVSAGSYGKGISFYDSTSTRYGYIQPHITTNNSRNLTLGADTGYLELGSHLVPYANRGVSLGQSSLRWSSVYADSYYYGTTAWGLDKANVWTGDNSFSKTIKSGGLTLTNNGRLFLEVPSLTKGTLPSDRTYYAVQNDYGVDSSDPNNRINQKRCWVEANGTNIIEWNLSAWNTTHIVTLRLSVSADATSRTYVIGANTFPETNGTYNLGTSTNKWKTLNGVNPGALSLPDFSAEFDVSGQIVPPTGETQINIAWGKNIFTPSVDGWLSIRIHKATVIKIYRETRASYCFESRIATADDICVCSPVVAGVEYTIKIQATQFSSGYDHFRLSPCRGNV